MDLTIQVTDPAGVAVTGATVVCTVAGAPAQGVSDAQGKFVVAPLPTASFTVDVTHSSYLAEQATVYPPRSGGSTTWDNPVCSVVPPATLVIRLSRLKAAPTFAISNSDLEQRAAFGPQAAFTWIDGNGNPTGRYLGMYNDVQASFMAVAHPLLPDAPTDGWGRIHHEKSPSAVDPSRNGDLVWLEWGLGRPEPRLAVAVWIPRFRGPTPSQLDYIVFFSPNTNTKDYPADAFPWLDKYPYWAQKGVAPLRTGGPLPLVQPYIGLAHRYLFFEKWLIHQLMAAKRQAIVVFPVQPYGDWGPFQEVAGLSRLLAEIAHFMHRTGLSSGGQSSTDQDQAPAPRYRFRRTGIQAPPPGIRRVVLSGFSAGMAPVISMLGTQIGQKLTSRSFSHALFGADVAPFLNGWKEVWDHDAPDAVRKLMDASLPVWLQQGSDRMARCYQSDDTNSGGWIDSTPLARFTAGPVKVVTAGSAHASERHTDARCSLVFFGSGYLHHATMQTATPPAFWTARNDHQAIPMVTFGHSARMSGLAKL
jgi:hypothetical protein